MNGWPSIDWQVGWPEVPKLPNFLLTIVRTVHGLFLSLLELLQGSEIFEKAALVNTQACKHTRYKLARPDWKKYLLLIFFWLGLEGKLIIISNRPEQQNVYTSLELTSLKIPSNNESVQFFTLFQIKLNNFICNHADYYFLCVLFSYLIKFIQCS